MTKNKNMDELFRDKLQNYEKAPPAHLLENVLAAAGGVKRNQKLIYWRIAGIAAAVLLAFIAGWQFNARNEEDLKQQSVVSRNPVPGTISPEQFQKDQGLENTPSASSSLQVASADVSVQEKNDKHQKIEGSSKREKIASPAKNLLLASNAGTVLVKPLKSIKGFINPEAEPKNTLQIQKIQKENKDRGEWAEKSIDQQIMEQNQQMIRTENQVRGKARWLVGAQVSPAYSVARSSHSQQYASNMLNSESASPLELGGGLSVEYKPSKRWSLQSGVYYSGLGQTSGNSSNNYNGNDRKDFSFASSDRGSEYLNTNVSIDANTNKMLMNSTAGVIEFSGVPSQIVMGASLEDKSMAPTVIVSDARFIQNFEYIEIPLYLRYTLIDARFDVEMLGGFSSNLLVGNQTWLENSAGKSLIGKTKDMEAMNYSGTLGVGLKYGLSKRIFLNVEPRIKYYLNSLNSNSSVTYKPYTIGVFTGLSYEF